MPAHGTPTMSTGRQLLLLILGGIVTALVIAGAVTVILTPRPASSPQSDPDARPVPTETPSPLPVAAPTAAVAPGTPKPASCDRIYSPAMMAAFGDLVLNPSWTTAPGAQVTDGTDDPELLAVIKADEHLSCRWVSPAGPSGSGVVTNVVWVTPEQSAAVQARLGALGFECYEELNGLRCITETTSDAGGSTEVSGQSHFLRDGIWLATRYVNAGPDGYTHDMVNTIWGGA